MGASVKLAVPRAASVLAFKAVTATVCWDAMLLGAVYNPLLLMLPSAGLSFHVTLRPEGRSSTANCCVFEAAIVAVAGLTLVVGAEAGSAGAGTGLGDPVELWGAEGSGAGAGLSDPAEGVGAGGSGVGDGLSDPAEGSGAGVPELGNGLPDPGEGSGAEGSGTGDVPDDPVTVPLLLPVIGGSNKTVALAVLVGSALLVAEIVTRVSELTGLRA